MTLAEIANYVCQKIGQTDAESIAAAKEFAKMRYRLIWDAALWSDAQALISVTADATDHSLIVFPGTVGRVIHLRNSGTNMNVLGSTIGTMFDFDASIFADSGTETKFIHLPPVPFTAATDTGTLLFTPLNVGTPASTDFDEDGLQFAIIGYDLGGALIHETVTLSAHDGTGLTGEWTIDFNSVAAASLESKGFILYDDSNTPTGFYFIVDGSGFAPDFASLGVSTYISIGITGTATASDVAGATVGALTGLFTTSVAGAAGVLYISALVTGPRTDAIDGNSGLSIHTIQEGILANCSASSTTSYSMVYSITKDRATTHSIQITEESGDTLGTMTGAALVFPANAPTGDPGPLQRIRVYPTPSTSQTYLAHVKTVGSDLINDTDAPSLSGSVNTLLAFTQADMLERQRQYAKSQTKTQEAQALLQGMLDLEKNQQSFEARIIPADIHGGMGGDDSFGSQGKGYW